jgi:hypothetical protein
MKLALGYDLNQLMLQQESNNKRGTALKLRVRTSCVEETKVRIRLLSDIHLNSKLLLID